jgi:microcystin-dependent protein
MDPLMASILIFAGNFVPNGYMPCDGRLLSISQYSALFSLLGTQFGGDGISTFGLPNLTPPHVNGSGQLLACIAIQGVYPSRSS